MDIREQYITKLQELVDKAKSGAVNIESFNLHAGIVEVEPIDRVRRFERSGEETITVVYRTPKEWNERN